MKFSTIAKLITISFTLLLLFYGCTETNSQYKINQKFADDVIKAFYIQGKYYEDNIRPIFANPPNDSLKLKIKIMFENSISDMLDSLRMIDTCNVSTDLVNIYKEFITYAEHADLYLKKTDEKFDWILFSIYMEQLEKVQSEFEEKCKQLNLELYAKGIS
ncbi:MAG: hypothetical protein V3V99_04860 [candidate division Zixibacteria bacterium]